MDKASDPNIARSSPAAIVVDQPNNSCAIAVDQFFLHLSKHIPTNDILYFLNILLSFY